MKIVGNEENVNMIEFRHKGKNIKFEHVAAPMSYITGEYLEERRENFHKSEKIEIIFDDLWEVNELISLLERFKDEINNKYIGIWRKL